MLHNLTHPSSISLDTFWSTASVAFSIALRFEKVMLATACCLYVSPGDGGTNFPTNHYVLLVKIRSLRMQHNCLQPDKAKLDGAIQ